MDISQRQIIAAEILPLASDRLQRRKYLWRRFEPSLNLVLVCR
jgi:hypothetical protein